MSRRRAILLVDHGSRRAEANAVLDAVADQLRARDPDCVVRASHMELAEPTLLQAFEACVAAGADEIVVQPYFLGPGRHSSDDIPRLVKQAAADHPGVRVAIAEPLGAHPGLVDAVLERVARARS